MCLGYANRKLTDRPCCLCAHSLLGSWSASTSPARSPSPSRFGQPHPHGAPHPHHSQTYRSRGGVAGANTVSLYGTTSLCQRSRSPSPARLQEMRERSNRFDHDEMGTGVESPPQLTLSLISVKLGLISFRFLFFIYF